jgi:hypothetical protein
MTIKHISGYNEWRRGLQRCENRNMRVSVIGYSSSLSKIATCEIYLLLLISGAPSSFNTHYSFRFVTHPYS